MSFYDWTPQLDVHVPAMNAQHKQILRLINQLHDETQAKVRPELIALTLGELGRVTVAHFAAEEQHMAAIGFPKLRTHAEIHRQLLEKFRSFVRIFEQSHSLGDNFFQFLKHWLSAHIQGLDKQYSQLTIDAGTGAEK